MGDVQISNGTRSRLWGLSVIVDVKEKEVISKGTGWCPALSFATVVKKRLKVAFKTWQLHFFHHPRYTHVRKTIKTLSYVSRIKTLPLALCHQNSQGLVLGSLLFTDTLCADDIGLLIHFPQIYAKHRITHVWKWTLNQASVMLVNLKQKSNSGIEYYWRTDSCTSL